MSAPRLLVVDDSKMIRTVMERRLREQGYEVTLADDGYQALDALSNEQIDLVIMDVLMPGMSGLDLLRVIRQAHSRTQLPIIMASSMSESGDIVEGMRLGANDYVTKPVDFPVLNVRIETQLAMRSPGDGAPKRDSRVYAKSLGPGSLINDRYEVLSALGSGGFAMVYKARQTSTGQECAIKILRHELLSETNDPAVEAERFKQEMKVIARLRHPNIVHLLDCGFLGDGQLFTVLELIEGESLADVIDIEGGMAPAEAQHLMLQVLDALSCAHSRGVVHRDLKPHNVMVETTGVRRNARVLDFGIAALTTTDPDGALRGVDEDGMIRGSPAYMAPELLRGHRATVQSDIYAWGLVFLECLTGIVAVNQPTVPSTILAQLDDRPVAIAESIPHSLRLILRRATAKSVEDRYASAVEALAELEDIQLGSLAETRRVPRPVFSSPGSQTRPAMKGVPVDDEDELDWLSEPGAEPETETRVVEPPPSGE